MIRNNNRTPEILNVDKPRREQHYLAKSISVSNILHGGYEVPPTNNHFIDSLQRFKKDFASYDKQQRQRQKQRRYKILEQRKNQQIQRESRMRRNQFQYDQRNMDKINQSRFLCEIGLKKTGFSNGLPMNPITLQYHQNPFGSQQQYTDQQQRLRRMVRAHHIQNSSTCGYNPINGTNLPSLDPLIPKNTQGRFQQKLGSFYEAKRLDPNVDLQLNPKQVLPRHVGQVEHGISSPIKSHKWQDEQPQFQSSYKSHFNQRPHQQMTNSRMQQSNLYKQYLPQVGQIGGASMYMSINNLGNAMQKHAVMQQQQNNQNINPYMQDSAYQGQLHDMRR